MSVTFREFVHPHQASRVRLRVYEPETGGFLLTEERLGAWKVVSTLGLFDKREEAAARLEARAAELERQRYSPATA
jgi:hypothetical protein